MPEQPQNKLTERPSIEMSTDASKPFHAIRDSNDGGKPPSVFTSYYHFQIIVSVLNSTRFGDGDSSSWFECASFDDWEQAMQWAATKPTTIGAPTSRGDYTNHPLDNVIGNIFEFVGDGNHLWIAPTCKRWNEVYKLVHQGSTTTSIPSLVESISRVQVVLSSQEHIQQIRDIITENSFSGGYYEPGESAPFLLLAEAAARQGQLEVLKLVMSPRPLGNTRTWIFVDAIRKLAIQGGHVGILKHFNQVGFHEWERSSFQTACDYKQADSILFLLKDTNCKRRRDICEIVAGSGQLEALQWLVGSGHEWDVGRCLRVATAGGHLDTIKWVFPRFQRLHMPTFINDEDFDMSAVDEALFSVSGPYRISFVAAEAAQNGHLHVLEWLSTNDILGSFTVEKVKKCAAKNGHDNIVAWIEQKYPYLMFF